MLVKPPQQQASRAAGSKKLSNHDKPQQYVRHARNAPRTSHPGSAEAPHTNAAAVGFAANAATSVRKRSSNKHRISPVPGEDAGATFPATTPRDQPVPRIRTGGKTSSSITSAPDSVAVDFASCSGGKKHTRSRKGDVKNSVLSPAKDCDVDELNFALSPVTPSRSSSLLLLQKESNPLPSLGSNDVTIPSQQPPFVPFGAPLCKHEDTAAAASCAGVLSSALGEPISLDDVLCSGYSSYINAVEKTASLRMDAITASISPPGVLLAPVF